MFVFPGAAIAWSRSRYRTTLTWAVGRYYTIPNSLSPTLLQLFMPDATEKPTPETLAGKLKRLRKERRVSLTALETKTGISRSYLSQLENGVQTNPSKDKLAALATFYQLNTNEFVFETPPALAGVTYDEFDQMARRLTQEQRNEVYPIIRRFAASNPSVA